MPSTDLSSFTARKIPSTFSSLCFAVRIVCVGLSTIRSKSPLSTLMPATLPIPRAIMRLWLYPLRLSRRRARGTGTITSIPSKNPRLISSAAMRFAKLHTYLGMAQILQRKNHVACVSGSLVENICTCPCKRKSSQEKPLHRVIAPCAEPCVWQRKRTCRANGAFSGRKSPSANRANARQNYVGYGLERLRKHSEKNCNATHPQLHAQDIRELPRVRNHVPLRTL